MFLGILFFIVLIIFFAAILPMIFSGAIFLPTQKKTAGDMLTLAKIVPGERAVDLGSGDGRLVISLAKAGAEAHGFEINPFLVWLSRFNIRRAGLSGKAFIHWKSFWQEDFSRYDVVTVFGISNIMERLEEKLKKEFKPSSRIVSNAFQFPHWQSSEKLGTVYLYEQK